MFPAKQISVAIQCSSTEVYDFVANPENLPKWASGLSKSKMVKQGNDWFADSPMGKVKVKFTERNTLGVLDHDVTLPSGEVVHNPLRVVPNSEGSEITFTLFNLPKASEEEFAKDAQHVEKDLAALKAILEN